MRHWSALYLRSVALLRRLPPLGSALMAAGCWALGCWPLGCWAACCLSACGVREMHVITAEDAGVIWIDGHPMGHREVTMATPRASATSLEWYRDGKRVGGKIVELDPPLGYSFPFDYLFEALLPLPPVWRTEFVIQADPPPPPPDDEFGPVPANPWRALLRQVQVEARAASIVGEALKEREALRMEGPTSTGRR